MTSSVKQQARKTAVDAAITVAEDIAAGKITTTTLEAQAAAECQALFGNVVGANDPLWALQCDVARQVIAAGGVPSNELQEWLAVQRRREPRPPSWIEELLAQLDDEAAADAVSEL